MILKEGAGPIMRHRVILGFFSLRDRRKRALPSRAAQSCVIEFPLQRLGGFLYPPTHSVSLSCRAWMDWRSSLFPSSRPTHLSENTSFAAASVFVAGTRLLPNSFVSTTLRHHVVREWNRVDAHCAPRFHWRSGRHLRVRRDRCRSDPWLRSAHAEVEKGFFGTSTGRWTLEAARKWMLSQECYTSQFGYYGRDRR
ncbi:UNVERIFIED_CONTAM: hypothetical protein HHA_312940 [Hammondia hammondi]|eukprot:XP_008883626.1 hypothetical protein HHA_312940 [Hammondia hammondi]